MNNLSQCSQCSEPATSWIQHRRASYWAKPLRHIILLFVFFFSDMSYTRKETEELCVLCMCMCMCACMCHQNLVMQRTISMLNKSLRFDGNTLHSLGLIGSPLHWADPTCFSYQITLFAHHVTVKIWQVFAYKIYVHHLKMTWLTAVNNNSAISDRLRSTGAAKVTEKQKSDLSFNFWKHANILGLFMSTWTENIFIH